MEYANYTKLLSEIGEKVGLDDTARLADGGQLDISGHAVSIRYDELADPVHALVHVDLGEVPAEDRETVYRYALEVNFHLASSEKGALSLDPQADRLHYSFRFPLNGTRSAADLLDTVTELVDALDGEDAAQAPEMPAHAAAAPVYGFGRVSV